MSTERPILFNTTMVRAILENKKTQTRRLVKGLPLAEPWFTVEDGKPMMCDENGEWYPAERFSVVQPGDILWVRETWQYIHESDTDGFYVYAADREDPSDWKWRPSIHILDKGQRRACKLKKAMDILPNDVIRPDENDCPYFGIV